MATDSTELTFVRCPSCRSLVPAVSSRCRMCGAGIDSGDDMSMESADSASESEDSGEDALLEADDAAAEGGDPLGDYLEDFEDDEDDQEEELDLADSLEEPLDLNGSGEAEEIEEFDPLGALEEEPPAVVPEPEPEPAPKVAKTKKAPARKAARKVEEAPIPKPSPRRATKTASRKTTDHVREAVGESRPTKKPSKRSTQEKKTMESEQINASLESAPSPNAIPERTIEGRLFGWLVSYRNPTGEAIELREGKFFVTNSPLKPNDLVLDEPSISTPHALLAMSPERGLQVQDLMSERGVFIRPQGGAAYAQEEETMSLSHGDWVRFGDREFLVTLIPTR